MQLRLVEIIFIVLVFIIGAFQLSFNDKTIVHERQTSYESCVRLRSKSPNFNLKCEQLLDIILPEKNEKNESNTNSKLKTLSDNDIKSRKINKNEELKLRLLIEKIIKKNSLNKNSI